LCIVGLIVCVRTPPRPLPELERNNVLRDHAEYIFKGKILGPESLAQDPVSGWVYSGLMNGEIIRFDPRAERLETFETFMWLNDSCKELEKVYEYELYDPELEKPCGRPLGMRFDGEGNLYVLESYTGLLKISRSGVKTVLYDGAKLANDLDLDGDDIYFTESSPRWGRNKIILEILSGRRTGKFLKYSNGKTTTLVDGLPLTNGVTISHDKEKVYFVAGPALYGYDRRTDTFEGVVVDNLPCIPDNVRRHPVDGRTYLVVCGTRRAKPFSLTDFLAPFPFVRELVVFLMCYNQYRILDLMPVHTMVLKLDVEMHQVVGSIQDPSGRTGFSSEAEKFGAYLYLGSWKENFLTRIPFDKTLL